MIGGCFRYLKSIESKEERIKIIAKTTKKFSTMDSLNINSKILYTNAKNFGIDLVSLYVSSAKIIVQKLLEKYGEDKQYAVICGLGGNGGDGFAIAKELSNKSFDVTVYLVGRHNNIEDPVSLELFNILKRGQPENLKIKQDCYAEDIESMDVVLECLIGTGIVGDKLNKRFGDVVKRVSHFKKSTVAIDIPAPSYKPDLTISLIYPKTADAIVVEMDLPKQLTMYPGPGEEEVLFKPKKHSYKFKNGKLLYISSTESIENLNRLIKYSQDYYVQLYVYSPRTINIERKGITILKDEDLDDALNSSDTIFLDQFSKNSLLDRALINEITKSSNLKYILSNSAIEFLKPEVIKSLKDKLFILDKDVLEKFNIPNKGDKGFKRISVEYKANLIIPSIQSYLYSDTGEFRLDLTGKLYHKETQQELLCLTGVLSTKNDMWLSLRAADYMLVGI
ncbi:MAG: NAD(P)H-hydrate epimerase [Candidatus Dojkabacteria bacterium]